MWWAILPFCSVQRHCTKWQSFPLSSKTTRVRCSYSRCSIPTRNMLNKDTKIKELFSCVFVLSRVSCSQFQTPRKQHLCFCLLCCDAKQEALAAGPLRADVALDLAVVQAKVGDLEDSIDGMQTPTVYPSLSTPLPPRVCTRLPATIHAHKHKQG